jgi:hypothetical protein
MEGTQRLHVLVEEVLRLVDNQTVKHHPASDTHVHARMHSGRESRGRESGKARDT